MTITSTNIKKAHKFFLNVLPLQEIDHPQIQNACYKYRKQRNYVACKVAANCFAKNYDYFENWVKTNKMINVFYFERD